MTDEVTPAPQRPESDKTARSGYPAAAPVAAVDSRAGQAWAQRKNASLTYCPAKAQRG